MWVEVKKAQTLMTAEMWKEFFEGEGLPTRILPASSEPMGQEAGMGNISYENYSHCHDSREHIQLPYTVELAKS